MPKIYTPIPSIQNSFARPSVISIIRQLKAELGIAEDVRVSFPDEEGISLQTGSAIGTSSEVFLPADEKVSVHVEESTNRERLLSNPQHQPGNRFSFRDEPLQVYLKTAYITRDVIITFKYRVPDRVKAERVRSDIEARMAMIRESFIHSIDYSYQIPELHMNCLRMIHSLREQVAGYGDDFEKWMRDHSLSTLTQLTDTGGKHGYYTFAERAVRLQGVFGFDTVPEKNEKEGAMTPHLVVFEYKLSWQAPVGMVMAYPVMIHNQVIPAKWRVTEKIKSPEDRRKITGSSADVDLSYFERTEHSFPVHHLPGITLPELDEWRPSTVPTGTLRIYSMLIKLDADNLTQLTRLDQIGAKYALSDELIEFLIGEAPYLNRVGMSVFHVGLFKDTMPIHQDDFAVNSELEIYSLEPLSLRDVHHVRFSVSSDWSLVHRDALERLARNPDLLDAVLKAIDARPYHYRRLENLVPRSSIEEIIAEMIRRKLGRDTTGFSVPRTVMTQLIQVRRK